MIQLPSIRKLVYTLFDMKRILTIDGGGIKGVYAASILAEIEKQSGVHICDYFDLIAGTSTGAIIAAALAIKIPAQNILDLYLVQGTKIFPKQQWRLLRGKYNTKPLEEILKSVFEEKCIANANTRLVIPTYNLQTDAVRIFKTPHSKDLFCDKDYKLYEVLLATTAAPVYFSPYKMRGGIYVDGGIGANNPSLIALTEGVTRCGWDIKDIRLLNVGSVGIGKNTTGKEKMGLLSFLTIQQCFMNAENQYASNICKLILKDNYIRIEESAQKGEVALDNVETHSLEKLKDLGMHSAQINYDRIRQDFLCCEKESVSFL